MAQHDFKNRGIDGKCHFYNILYIPIIKQNFDVDYGSEIVLMLICLISDSNCVILYYNEYKYIFF